MDMKFLEEVLGSELFSQVESKLNEYNGNEANKEKQIKLANLTSGEYVGKGKYDAEVTASQNKDVEIENYKAAIADLQKANKNNEAIQERIQQLEAENTQLKKDQEESEIKYAFDVLLMDAGVTDKDEREFLAYKYEKKLTEEGKTLELDENKHIKDGEGIVETLKTTFPTRFQTSDGENQFLPLDNNGLPKGDPSQKLTKAELLKKPYAERTKLFSENPEAYKAAMNNN